MNKKLLIFKRKKAKELHEKDWSNRKIARHILASKNSYFIGPKGGAPKILRVLFLLD